MVAHPGSPETILPAQQEILQDGAAKEGDTQVTDHNGVARDEARGVFAAVDVADDDALEVGPAHGETQRDAALVDALGVVGQPCHRVGDAWVDAHACQKGAGVFGARGQVANQDAEADDAQGRYGDRA